MMDLRAQQFFKDEKSFHEAMRLLGDYLEAQGTHGNLEDVSLAFLDQLDDETGGDSKLLTQALKYYRSRQLDNGIDSYRNPPDFRMSAQSTTTGKSLCEAFEEFLDRKRPSWKESGGMEKNFRTYYAIFNELVGNLDTGELTKSHVNEYINVVQSLPSNRTKHQQYNALKIRDFLELDVPESARLSNITRKRYLSQMNAFFEWLYTNDYSKIELHLPIRGVKIPIKRSQDQRAAYTKEDIKKLLNSSAYVMGTHKKASHFWVPLIALYAGARLNEICQLSVADIYKDDETKRWVFDINENIKDDPLKSLKKPFHARLVPVHDKLLGLGLLDYLKAREKNKDKRLFPDLPYVSGANKYGDKLQRWFNRTYTNKNNCNITTEGTSFHSLRHTVITHLVNDKKADPNRIATGFGQTPQGGVTQTTYTKRMPLADYIEYFDQINFDDAFDSSVIKHWKFQRFSR